MAIRDSFKESASIFKKRSDMLYQMVDDLRDRLIIWDLSNNLGIPLKKGFNVIPNSDIFEEIQIGDGVFNFINKSKNKYKAYVLHLEKAYNLPYLGFKYKNEIVSPHMESQVDGILSKYDDKELSEILEQVRKRIDAINKDIGYLESLDEISEEKFFYRNYDGMFDGAERFDNLEAVLNDFKLFKA